jgi:hypothetical protein
MHQPSPGSVAAWPHGAGSRATGSSSWVAASSTDCCLLRSSGPYGAPPPQRGRPLLRAREPSPLLRTANQPVRGAREGGQVGRPPRRMDDVIDPYAAAYAEQGPPPGPVAHPLPLPQTPADQAEADSHIERALEFMPGRLYHYAATWRPVDSDLAHFFSVSAASVVSCSGSRHPPQLLTRPVTAAGRVSVAGGGCWLCPAGGFHARVRALRLRLRPAERGLHVHFLRAAPHQAP